MNVLLLNMYHFLELTEIQQNYQFNASTALSEVTSVFGGVVDIITSLPGWNIFVGAGIVTLLGGILVGVVSGIMHRR